MLQRHAVQVLLGAGHTQAEVAEHTGVSERTVRRIAKEPAAEIMDTEAAPEQCGVGRPSLAKRYLPLIVAILKREPKLQGKEIIRRMKSVGYEGKDSAAYALIKTVRVRTKRFVMLFDGLPGEFSQHDFGSVWVTFTDGSRMKVRLFATRMKYSRWAEVTVVKDETSETLVRTLVEHFERIGGRPLLSVFDRPKTIAVSWQKDGRVTKWNETFQNAMFQMGLGAELCWPYSPEQKGSVERLVGWVKSSFFGQREFVDMEDLLQQLAEWVWEVNHVVPCRATGVRPVERMALERARLRPLTILPEELALRYPIRVGPMAEVVFQGCRYSMPPDALGLPGTLHLHKDRVRIVAGRWEATHKRLHERGSRSVHKEHLQSRVAKVSGRRGKHYLMRQHLLELGDVAGEYITELVYHKEGDWYHEIKQLHEFLLAHGPDAMRDAFRWALSKQLFSPHRVREFLVARGATEQEPML